MKFRIKCLAFLWLVVMGLSVSAQVADRPADAKLYNNLSKAFPDFLDAQEAAQLEEKLEVFSNETSNQICVVIVDDFNGMDASSYATELGESWGVGQKGKNNGIVVLVKPTKEDGGRALFIAVGYGLEGAIPDLATKRIREDEIQPLLKEGRYYDALDQGTTTLMKLAKGEINVKSYTRGRSEGKGGGGIITIIIIIIFVIIFLRSMFGGGGGGGRTMSRAGEALFWGSMLSNMGRGGRSSGGWGGSSGGGGGWGGFGGGSFGGGGSGGSW